MSDDETPTYLITDYSPMPYAGPETGSTAGPAGPTPDPRGGGRRRRRGALGVVAAAALLSTGAGAGYLVRGGSPATSAATSTTTATSPTAPTAGGVAPGSGYALTPGTSGGTSGFGGFGSRAGGYTPYGSGSTSTRTSSLNTTAASAAQLVGMVRIVSTTEDGKSIGTGMILTSAGEVVTNHHVVEGATKTTVTVMSSGATYTADVVGTKAKADIAVLQLQDASGLTPVTLDDDTLAAGDAITAVGDAEGLTRLSAATGTVSALRKPVTTSSEGSVAGEKLHGLIEIDADVISGDSGGATVDSEGEVVGMTTAASTGGATVTGYAIPVARVTRIAARIEQLAASGTSTGQIAIGYAPFLGVGLQPSQGTTIAGVITGSPAAKAGLVGGDTITAVGGAQVRTSAALRRAIAAYAVGDRVTVTWTDTAGKTRTGNVTLAKAPVA